MIGIKNGMVMQRGDDGTCSVFLTDTAREPAVAFAPMGTEAHTPAAVAAAGKTRWRVTGIPVGGPYVVTVDGESFTQIYVGDVWVLAGQSNMEGVGWMTIEDEAFAGVDAVRALYMTDTWDLAKHPLHDLGRAVDGVHGLLGAGIRPMHNSVGPSLAFALEMNEMTGVPQGLICCAHGGSSLAMWSPDKKGEGGNSLYGAMLRRFHACGGNVRGMFWYQGCSDACGQLAVEFGDTTTRFFASCRRDFEKDVPIVQVQIGRCSDIMDEAANEAWTRVREHQRALHEKVKGLATVAAVAKALDDTIHISSAEQRELGREAAKTMYWLLWGTDGEGCLPPPEYVSYTLHVEPKSGWVMVDLAYRNLHGGLMSGSRPAGFIIAEGDGVPKSRWIYKTELRGNTVRLYTSAMPEQLHGCRLYYGYGSNPYCNITDCAGRSIPSMGPVILHTT